MKNCRLVVADTKTIHTHQLLSTLSTMKSVVGRRVPLSSKIQSRTILRTIHWLAGDQLNTAESKPRTTHSTFVLCEEVDFACLGFTGSLRGERVHLRHE